MNAKRKKVEDFILSYVSEVVPGDKSNVKLLQEQWATMSDKQFETWLEGLKPARTAEDIKQRHSIPIIVPNMSGHRVSIANNYRLVKKLGQQLEHRLIMTDGSTGEEYVTPHYYPVYDLPVRRQAQTQMKKSSIPSHNQRVDDLTDQPTSLSKGSRISSVEMSSLLGRRLDNTVTEFVGIRGGNAQGYREYRRQLIETGRVSLKDLEGLGMRKSTLSMAIYLNCMMLGNNLDKNTVVPEDAKPETLRSGRNG